MLDTVIPAFYGILLAQLPRLVITSRPVIEDKKFPVSYFSLTIYTLIRVVMNTTYRMIYPFLSVFARGLGVDISVISGLVANRAIVGAVDPFFFLTIDVPFGRPVVNIATELHFVLRSIEVLQLMHAALAAQNPLPQIVNLAAERCDGAKAGDHDTSFHDGNAFFR